MVFSKRLIQVAWKKIAHTSEFNDRVITIIHDCLGIHKQTGPQKSKVCMVWANDDQITNTVTVNEICIQFLE